MTGLLRIGELARLGDVSVKALRFYDDQGLLRPEHVDPRTGYRYYTLAQAETLAMITNLRMVDFTIAEIAALLGEGNLTPEGFRAAIETKRHQLETARAGLERKIDLAAMMAQSAITGTTSASNEADQRARSTFKLAPLSDKRVYSLKNTTPTLGPPVKEMFETAERIVAEHDARSPDAPFLIFHTPPTQSEDLALEVCIPIDDDPNIALTPTIIPGSEFSCSIVYSGGYFKTESLYERMSDWIANAGLSPAGPMRELYHRFGADQNDYRLPTKMLASNARDYLTELQIPVSLDATR